ncbi:hypothetical protein SD80_012220 [Scytonema tolypothrichoides VB-61278]|nr:hypothetical protein SD80_012220 [Scytonema tolypothrichoides VB-61278]
MFLTFFAIVIIVGAWITYVMYLFNQYKQTPREKARTRIIHIAGILFWTVIAVQFISQLLLLSNEKYYPSALFDNISLLSAILTAIIITTASLFIIIKSIKK